MKRTILFFVAAVLTAAFVLSGCSAVTQQEQTSDKYTVTFCDNGEVLCYQSVEKNGYANKILPPEKYGYDFVCWLYYGEEYSFSNPVTSDITLEVSRKLSEWTITFSADGKTVEECTYNAFSSLSDITLPKVPEKAGYTGVWEEFSLTYEDITVNAVYGAIDYTAKFIADDHEVDTVTFTVEDEELSAPAVPEKVGYTGYWDKYEIIADDMLIYAVYEKITYHVYFYANDMLIYTAEYVYGDTKVNEPEVPENNGVQGAWESYELGAEDITVYAVYPQDSGSEQEEQSGSQESDTGSGSEQSGTEQSGSESQSGETGGESPSEVQTSESSLEFAVVTGGYEVTGLKSGVSLTEVVIPATHDGNAVVSIGANAFYFNFDIKKVTILGGVESIGEFAFFCCYSLVEVNLPSTLQEICDYAFSACSFEQITLPDSLITIGERAFYYSDLHAVTIPDSVETIKYQAFYHCASLTKAVIGKSVNLIEKDAFYYCDNLKEAVFCDLSGWCVKEELLSEHSKELDLSDTLKAAEYLRLIHSGKYFIKS